jgi:transcription antitermination factor NusG
MEMIRENPGITRIVSFGGKPHPVADEEIEAIRRIVDSDRNVESFPYLDTGDRVQVISGPLLGLVGIITQVKKRDRLVISVDLVMKSVCVDIDRSEVMPLDDEPVSARNALLASATC